MSDANPADHASAGEGLRLWRCRTAWPEAVLQVPRTCPLAPPQGAPGRHLTFPVSAFQGDHAALGYTLFRPSRGGESLWKSPFHWS